MPGGGLVIVALNLFIYKEFRLVSEKAKITQ